MVRNIKECKCACLRGGGNDKEFFLWKEKRGATNHLRKLKEKKTDTNSKIYPNIAYLNDLGTHISYKKAINFFIYLLWSGRSQNNS